MKNRVGRVIIGILALVLFGYYTFKQEQIRTHSMDPFIVSLGPAVPLHPEGFEEGVDMSADLAEAQQEPVQMNYATPAPAAPAAPAAPEILPPFFRYSRVSTMATRPISSRFFDR